MRGSHNEGTNLDPSTEATEARARAAGLTSASALRLPLVIRRKREHTDDTCTYGVALTDEELSFLHRLLTMRIPGTRDSAVTAFDGLRDLRTLLERVQRGD